MWIPLTVAAAFLQNLRSLLQKRLTGILSVNGAAYARFCYAAPFAWLYLLMLGMEGPDGLTRSTSASFWAYCSLGALAQILATALLLSAFTLRSFAVSTALSKTEAVQTAAVGFVLLGEAVSPMASAGICISLAGVWFLTGGVPVKTVLGNRRALALGLLAGTCFAVAAVGYRGAALALPDGSTLVRAGLTLAVALAIQTLVMGAYLALREPGELRRVASAWRPGIWVGACGAAASACWFTAMTLQTSALVRALGQVELLFALAASHLVFRERVRAREVAGIAVLVLGIYLLL